MSLLITYTSNLGNTLLQTVYPKQFSAGEIHTNIKKIWDAASIDVTANIRSSNDLMHLVLVSDILQHQHPQVSKKLFLPYLPYSRQDRRCADGDASSLMLLGKILSISPYNEVRTLDAHNEEAAKGYIPNLVSVPQHEIVYGWGLLRDRLQAVMDSCPTLFVAPDKGAVHKTAMVAGRFRHNSKVVSANKVRDPKTGALSGTEIPGLKQAEDDTTAFIFDDICDGGRTFVELARALKQKHNVRRVVLYVTHGIMPRGCGELFEWIDAIYVTNYIGPITPDKRVVIRSSYV